MKKVGSKTVLKAKLRPYGLISEALDSAVKMGVRRAFKHSGRCPDDERIVLIAEQVVMAFWSQLEEAGVEIT